MRNAWRYVASSAVWLLWLVAFAPFWLWLACVIEVIVRRAGTGRWPTQQGPRMDPPAAFMPFVHLSPWLAAALLGIAALLAWYITAKNSLGRRFLIVAGGIVVLWAAAWGLMVADPGDILSWALD